MNKFLLILFLWGCLDSKKLTLDSLSKKTSFCFYTEELSSNAIKNVEKKIEDEYKFLTSLFEQSYDPYYGNPRWEEECLEENKIEPIIKTNKGVFLIHRLYYSNGEKVGFCSTMKNKVGKLDYIQTIKYHCYGENFLKIIKIDADSVKNKNILWTQLCE